MLQLVVVMLKRALGVVGRINEDAFHPSAIKRQQRFERQQVVTLNQQVFRFRVAMRGLELQQVIGNVSRDALRLGLVDPIKKRHGACL